MLCGRTFKAHLEKQDVYAQDLFGGADLDYRVPVTVITEFAWHSLFIRHLLRLPTADEAKSFRTEFTIINCPSFRADPAKHGTRSETVIAVNFSETRHPDRRHVLCRRDQEVGLHDPQLPAARPGRDADALLGQHV
jgi:ATP-dependent phosphoenolpyruvate carboxykinase